MASIAKEDQKKNSQPHVVVLNEAFKMAEQWVNKMTKSSVNKGPIPVELEGRPSRLGIGATVPKESKFVQPNNPIERKLLSKLQAERRKMVKRDADKMQSAKDGNDDDDNEEDELDSKTRTFSKKRPQKSPSHLAAKRSRGNWHTAKKSALNN